MVKATNHRGPVALVLLIAVALLVLLYPLEGNIEKLMGKQADKPAAGSAVEELGGVYYFLQLAGLNSVLADILWLKADDLWHSSSWWQLTPVMEAIVRIDPKFTLVWRTLAWHYGWNLAITATNSIDKARWTYMAMDTYSRALKADPDDQELWGNVAWFYVSRARAYDKAEAIIKQGMKRFPNEIDVLERRLQRVYEKTWQIDKAIAVIKDILRKRPSDVLAQRDLAWWEQYQNNQNWRWVLEYRENKAREQFDLPWFENPFEGSVVPPPPWRDRSKTAPRYMNPDWKPDLSEFPLNSIQSILIDRPDLAKQWHEAHPNVPLPPPVEKAIKAG